LQELNKKQIPYQLAGKGGKIPKYKRRRLFDGE